MPVSISGDGAITGLDLADFEDVSGTPTDGQFLAWNSSTSKWEPTTMSVKEKRIARFTGSGTWTVPAGVTYAIAHMLGGGGGIGSNSGAGGNGGNSSVAFAGGTVTCLGGTGGTSTGDVPNNDLATAGQANSGRGAVPSEHAIQYKRGIDSTYVVAAATVAPAASITVTVGAGGTSTGFTGRDGGSGYVYIEYYEEV